MLPLLFYDTDDNDKPSSTASAAAAVDVTGQEREKARPHNK